MYVKPGHTANVTCEIFGYPASEVTCSFGADCSDGESCKSHKPLPLVKD